MTRLLLLIPLLLAGCMAVQPSAFRKSDEADRLLHSGLNELVENHPTPALESLLQKHPQSEQAVLAERLLKWKQQAQTSPPAGSTSRKGVSAETELRELKEENRRLRNDLEQLRRLLIESERRAR